MKAFKCENKNLIFILIQLSEMHGARRINEAQKNICLNFYQFNVNPLSANFIKWSNKLKQFELFECVWPFCVIGA